MLPCETQMPNSFKELNCEAKQTPNWFLSSNWLNHTDQGDSFGSALIPSPSPPSGRNVIISKLIGSLGNLENGESNGSTNASCYSAPLSSPLSSMADPSIGGSHFPICTNGRSGLSNGSLVMPGIDQSGKISSASKNKAARVCGVLAITAGSDSRADSGKRKSICCENFTETPSSSCLSASDNKVGDENDEARSVKRSKQDETSVNRNENTTKKSKNEKISEPSKDYIHVRARRGQATDSHSLAERVRREKTSERMKMLQDLVPGCDKVTGKAVMLDEIINYVQSLQRQVEFLSMKLTTLNPMLDFNKDAHLPKEMIQMGEFSQHNVFPVSSPEPGFCFGYQSLKTDESGCLETQFSLNPLTASLHINPSMQLPMLDAYAQAYESPSRFQAPIIWENDLQNVVHMGFRQDKPLNIHIQKTSVQMKLEQ